MNEPKNRLHRIVVACGVSRFQPRGNPPPPTVFPGGSVSKTARQSNTLISDSNASSATFVKRRPCLIFAGNGGIAAPLAAFLRAGRTTNQASDASVLQPRCRLMVSTRGSPCMDRSQKEPAREDPDGATRERISIRIGAIKLTVMTAPLRKNKEPCHGATARN